VVAPEYRDPVMTETPPVTPISQAVVALLALIVKRQLQPTHEAGAGRVIAAPTAGRMKQVPDWLGLTVKAVAVVAVWMGVREKLGGRTVPPEEPKGFCVDAVSDAIARVRL
jgi:hypothetical protein